MSLWDTHCHLADAGFDGDRLETAARAAAAGVHATVVVAADPDAWDAAARLADPQAWAPAGEGGSPRLPLQIFFAYGLHPHEARLASDALWLDLKTRLAAPGVVALGEIGLDYHYDHSPRRLQRDAFERQLTLAAECGLPVILHEREAAVDLLAMLRSTGLPPRGGVWHCFSGGPQLAAEALDLGFHLGFGGLVTFRRGTEAVRLAALECPVERMVLETDAPYLAPVPYRGRRNEPAFVAGVLAFLAEWRGVPPEALALATSRNAEALFAPRPASGSPPAGSVRRSL